MAITVKHSKVSTIPDDADTSLVRPSDWNADHTLVGTIDVANGGTGAATLTGYVKGNGTSAMTAVATVPSTDITGLGTMSTQNANAVAITGGTINGTTIGATTPSTVNATTITGQTGVLRGTGNNLFINSQLAGGTSGTLGSGAVSPTSWSFVTTGLGGSITYASALSGTGNSIRLTSTSARVGLSANSISSITAGVTYSFSFNIEAVTNAASLTLSSFLQLNGVSSQSLSYFVNGSPALSSTVPTANSKVQIVLSFTGTLSQFRWGIGLSGAETGDVTFSNPQIEVGSTLNTYIPTTTTAVYGTPTLSFSGVSSIGLLSNGALYLQPAGTGALQAQATTSTTAGGNARGSNAVDWQTSRSAAGQVASGGGSFMGAGTGGTASGAYSFVGGGVSNNASAYGAFTGGGWSNTTSQLSSTTVGGYSNTAAGYLNFVGGGQSNSGTANAAVTTQSATMNGTTAVTLSGSNASIKVGQYITGTSIANFTYVAAISGTSLTLSQNASGSSTSTLSFFTPHGVVVGGGNNQATGAYSAILGGGDAGTAANRNVASGDWSVVCGGRRNTASGVGSFVGGGGVSDSGTFPNTASGVGAALVGGFSNTSSGFGSFVGGGYNNAANSLFSGIMSGEAGTTRSIIGNHVFPACSGPISASQGVSQAALLILGVQTTDATATALRSNNSAASTINQVILPNNSAYFFTGEVVSGKTAGGDTKGWTIEGVIKRGANAASTALVGTPTVTSTYADAGASTWVIAVTADTTNGGLRVTFTGQAATTIRTVCQIRTTEMTY
jgi:hypothetical protein